MIHYDYLMRLIEVLAQTLARIQGLRRGQQPQAAGQALDQELRELLAADRRALLQLTNTEILARLLRAGAAHEVQTRLFFLVALLQEAGTQSAEAGDDTSATAHRVQALRLLLESTDRPDPVERPEFTPTVDALLRDLGGAPIPPDLQARLMAHHEQEGRYALAEDSLWTLLDELRGDREAVAFGAAFYQRLLGLHDDTLARGGLPRAEVEEGLERLQSRAV